jgi:hypothetical protein
LTGRKRPDRKKDWELTRLSYAEGAATDRLQMSS